MRKALLAAILTTLTCASPALASWPMGRHDAQRTGRATGVGDITKPVPYFKTYLGGSLGQSGLLMLDVDGDTKREVVMVTGGRIVAKALDDTQLYATPPLGISSLLAAVDLDGDGKVELVAARQAGAIVLDAATGAVRWTEPDGDIGALGGLRVDDFDGDGKPDLVAQECGCCGVNSGKTGFFYSFANGFVAPKLLSTLPYVSCGGGRSLTVVRGVGAARSIVVGNHTHFGLIDPVTGTELAGTAALGTWIGASNCAAADVDGVTGDELLCVLNSSDLPAMNQRRAFLLKPTLSPASLTVVWDKTLAPDAGGDLAVGEGLVDLDLDGQLEFVVATQAAGVWTTRVLDAKTGNELATTAGPLAGTAPVLAGKKHAVLVSGTLAYAFDRTKPSPLTLVATLIGERPSTTTDLAKSARQGLATRVVALDQDADGVDDLVTVSASAPFSISTWSLVGAAPKKLASYTFPSDVDPLNVWPAPPMTEITPQVAVARNDGFLTFFDKALSPVNEEVKSVRPGVRIGGYYGAGGWRDLGTTPRTAPLDATNKDVIVTNDSRGALVALDAKDATMLVPPKRLFQRLRTTAPSIVPTLDGGKPGLFCTSGANVVALKATGADLWTKATPGRVLGDPVPLKLDAGAVPDVAITWNDPSDVMLHTWGLSGVDGAPSFQEAPFTPGAGVQPAGLSSIDWDGDGIDDVLQQGGSIRVTSGATGQLLTTGGSSDAYFLLTLDDLDGDTTPEIVAHGGYSPARAFTKAFSGVWTGTEDDRPYPYAAIASCASGKVMVNGSWAEPSLLKLTSLSGATLGQVTKMYFAGGQSFPTAAAAKASGLAQGQLTSATVHQSLSGATQPRALVGSADGHLYGVDPCAGTLAFAVAFPAAVGEAVYGDTNADGKDEIIVTVADGYLYGLRQESIVAPSLVRDLDPCKADTGADLDTVATIDTLSAAWDAVPGATAYEVTLLDASGFPLLSPAWKDVGNVTTTKLTGLALSQLGVYRVAVRAKSAAGVSPDVASDGVTVFGQPLCGGAGGSGGAAGAAGAGGASGASGAAGSGGTAGNGGAGGAAGSAGGGKAGASGTGGAAGVGGAAGGGGGSGAAGTAGSGVAGKAGGSVAGAGGVASAGKAGSATAGQAAAGSAGAPASADGASTSEDSGGCGCRTTPANPTSGASLLLVALAAAVRRRRER